MLFPDIAPNTHRRWIVPIALVAGLLAAGCAAPRHSGADPTVAPVPHATAKGKLSSTQFEGATAEVKKTMRAVVDHYRADVANPLCDGDTHKATSTSPLINGKVKETLVCHADATSNELRFSSTATATTTSADYSNTARQSHGMTVRISHPDHGNKDDTLVTYTYNGKDGDTPVSSTFALENPSWGTLAATPEAVDDFIADKDTVVARIGFTATALGGQNFQSLDMFFRPDLNVRVVQAGIGAEAQLARSTMAEELYTLRLGLNPGFDDLVGTALH